MQEEQGGVVAGFVVHAFSRTHDGETQLCLAGRLASLETFAVVLTRKRPHFYIRTSDGDRAERLIEQRRSSAAVCTTDELRTMDGETCRRIEARTQSELSDVARGLQGHAIRTYEADIRLPESFLINRSIHGSVELRGKWRKGRRVDRVYIDPEIAPASWAPTLSIASIDIETNPYGPEIYAIATHFRSCTGELRDHVLLSAPEGHAAAQELRRRGIEKAVGDQSWTLEILDGEQALLSRWAVELVRLDPDLITGWNVTGFDFGRIFSRLRHFGLPFRVGRSGESGNYFPAEPGKPATVVIPGRQVLDGMRIARAGPERFADHSLETVATAVLGRGKQISVQRTRERLQRIEEMYRNDPLALSRYCLEDARLVTEILERTGLLDLTLKRSLLIGVPLSRAWTSIAAFDFVYIEAMHRRGIVAPTVGVDPLPMDSAPGGAIISPFSGLFDNVLVFDFKSLYPSIIRTFNIDPLSYCGRRDDLRRREEAEADVIEAPNGACFRREEAILPALLETFFARREEARREGDRTGVHVYKILMNSFYGVLGASGCRFAGSDLAGAITAFGHEILHWCRDLLEHAGFHIFYGDTDSLFLQSNLPRGATDTALRARGGELRDLVNRELAEHLSAAYGVESRLELEFEKVYLRFFVPPLRGHQPAGTAAGAGGQRGRAKGYAGYLHRARRGSETGDSEDETLLEVKGMEAVRRDWTEAAREFQMMLLRMVFEDVTSDEVAAYVRGYIASMRSGKLDAKLVYSKALRKSVAQYANAAPPHVQAARHLDKLDQSGLVSYLWTLAGPQPVGAVTAPIDYEHYVEKQLKPIAGTFSEVLHSDFQHLFDSDGQLNLF